MGNWCLYISCLKRKSLYILKVRVIMILSEAEDIKTLIYRSFDQVQVCNDFDEIDQYYLRLYIGLDNRQVLLKGSSIYNLRLVFVGLGASGIDYEQIRIPFGNAKLHLRINNLVKNFKGYTK